MKNPYETLGVQPDATLTQIKLAWRRLCKELHPDRNNGQESERFKEVNDAYDLLTNPARADQLRAALENPVDRDAKIVVAELFGEALDKVDGDLLAFVRHKLAERLAQVRLRLAGHERLVTLLEKHRGKVKLKKKGKGKVDIFHALLEKRLAVARDAIAASENLIAIALRATDILDGYEFVGEPLNPGPQVSKPRRFTDFGVEFYG